MATAKPNSSSGRYLIPVVRSTFQIISELSRNGPLTLNETVLRTGVPKSTVFRVLATLLELGVAVKDKQRKTYRLGATLFDLTGNAARLEVLRRIAHPYMLKLRNLFGETVNLGQLEHDKIVYLEVAPSEYALRFSERPGATTWALSSALGRCILAFSPPELADGLIDERSLPRLTKLTITDPRKLRHELERVRAQGYAVEAEENVLQATCLGVPLLNQQGVAMAALSISGPTTRFRPDLDRRVVPALLEAAREIEREFQC